MTKKYVYILLGVAVLFAFLAWLFIESSKPLPGEKIASNCDSFMDFSKLENAKTADKCRIHVPEATLVNYSTNPPTLGPHSASWITKGFYDTSRFDGNLVHSLEHGYVVISYDCERKGTQSVILNLIQDLYRFRIKSGMTDVYAQGMTAGSEGSPSASLESMPKAFSDGSCDVIKNQIRDVIKKSGDHKLIAVPRVGMDHQIILTAWGRILKLNSVDQSQMKQFIDSFRDAGPEHTVEP